MTGSIQKKGKTYYAVIPINGRRKWFKGGTKKDAERVLGELSPARPKLFACGPTAMLRAVAALAIRQHLPCEVSLEGAMACGIGICQGCPVELAGEEKKYALMCKDGPTFDVRSIRL